MPPFNATEVAERLVRLAVRADDGNALDNAWDSTHDAVGSRLGDGQWSVGDLRSGVADEGWHVGPRPLCKRPCAGCLVLMTWARTSIIGKARCCRRTLCSSLAG
jgi:hypothetical protein